MIQTRRQFLVTSGAFGAALAFGACGGSDSDSDSGGGASAEDLKGGLTFVTWGGPAELAAYKAIIKKFEAKYPGATVKLQEVPYDEVKQTVDASLEAQRGPDLFRVSYTDFGFYASQNALVDLSEHLPDGYADAFTPGMWEAVSYEEKPYGIPQHTDVSAIVYNKDLFATAGITTVPDTLENAWSWDEFLDVARKVRDAQTDDKKTAFGMNWQQGGAYRWLNWLYAAGGSLYDEGLTAAAVDSDAGRKTLDQFKLWFDEGLVPKSTTPKGGFVDELFPSQTVGMISAGDFLLPSFVDTVKKFEYGATFLPQDASAATDLGGNAVVATRVSKKPALAAKFAEFLGDTDNMKTFCEQTGVLPTRTELTDAKLDYAVSPDLMPVFVSQATTLSPEYVKAVTVPGFTKVNQAFVDQLEAFLVSGQSADDTLANIGGAATEGLQS